VYISSYDALSAFCEHAVESRVLAVDTEFLRDRTYFPKLCLIQIATDRSSAVVDPLMIDDLSPLKALLVDKRITKVFHSCSQDLEVILDALGVVAAPVFDTQVAAAFVGMRQQVGYAAVVERYTGVHLPKADSLTDWSKRPLDEEQLSYAEDDVRYLPGIYDAMMAQLVAKNRLGWVAPEMEELTDRSRIERLPELAYLHLKRSGSLTRRQLGIAREACAWRERTAAERNLPRRWVLSDELLVEVCKRAPKSVERLRRIRGLEQLGALDADRLVRAVQAGLAAPSDSLPVPRRREQHSTDSQGVVDLMNALLRIVSEKEGVAPQLVASRDDLLDLASGKDGCALRSGWRYKVAGEQLERLLSGELGLTIKNGKLELL
jgi:ribonuclease D